MRKVVLIAIVVAVFLLGFTAGRMTKSVRSATSQSLAQSWRFEKKTVKAQWEFSTHDRVAEGLTLGFFTSIEASLAVGSRYSPILLEILRKHLEQATRETLDFLNDISVQQSAPIS